tara:strand:- start:179 stop:472 length:294 start_codon:yes stop_codon:yes gene_type:complete
MNHSEENIEILERNIVLLLNRLKDNYYTIGDLKKKIELMEKSNAELVEKNNLFKEENISLKSANSLLGSNEGDSIMKNKINDLIKHVDYCLDKISTL